MSVKWFVCQNEHVSGPLSTEQVQAKLQAAELQASDAIWGRELNGWQTLAWWTRELPRLHNSQTFSGPSAETWHYALGGKSHGPFTRASLVSLLRTAEPISEVMVWTKGMKEWAPIYEFHDLISEAGVNKRQFPRAELSGQVTIKIDGTNLTAPLLSISEGGLSVQLETNLVSGQPAVLEVQSPSFRAPIIARSEVRYANGGIIGFRFTNINSESKGAIIQLVRQNQATKFVLKAA